MGNSQNAEDGAVVAAIGRLVGFHEYFTSVAALDPQFAARRFVFGENDLVLFAKPFRRIRFEKVEIGFPDEDILGLSHELAKGRVASEIDAAHVLVEYDVGNGVEKRGDEARLPADFVFSLFEIRSNE
jgi:hypothetical protein